MILSVKTKKECSVIITPDEICFNYTWAWTELN